MVSNVKPLRLDTVAWYEDDEFRALVDQATAASYDAAFAPAPAPDNRRRIRRSAKASGR
ncbi:hypothetical protein G5V59_27565 [Nocardioides sp. W3-2-3]|uniref:hypothetical protein n=1 Tax=Nocardioides convexus TaxID=2712224 RepID=UPI0024186981|nr:hypothetical protein [Nocardioides convexus]NHA02140.1 hypothetical protein [Nocardioides convexus]